VASAPHLIKYRCRACVHASIAYYRSTSLAVSNGMAGLHARVNSHQDVAALYSQTKKKSSYALYTRTEGVDGKNKVDNDRAPATWGWHTCILGHI
jgi:hypothetical protein